MSVAPTPPIGGMPAFEASGLRDAVNGVLLAFSSRPIRGGAVDSRRVVPGACFFALPGERTDGHRFLADAARAGAAAVVVSRDLDAAERRALEDAAGKGITLIRVADGLSALHAAAEAWRTRFSPIVVGITGSLAKTSTKEAIAETLSQRWSVLRNEGNENNEVGLPLTLLRLGPEHEVAVLEMGMYQVGEIATLARLARPRIGVITAVRGTHLSRAGSIDAIERGKAELVEALPADGWAILNADDPRVDRMAARTRARTVRYGFAEAAEVTATDVESLGELGMRFDLRTPAGRIAAASPALGRHSVHNALAAAAVGTVLGLTLTEIARGVERGFSAPHRTRLVHAGAWRILDDSYNAGPDSMAAALDLLGTLPGRRVAVLGEMLELGPEGEAAHHEVGRRAASIADLIVTVGDGGRAIAEGARERLAAAAGERFDAGSPARPVPEVVGVPERSAALDVLVERLAAGDVVLVKGSRGVALDLLVDRLVEIGAGRTVSS